MLNHVSTFHFSLLIFMSGKLVKWHVNRLFSADKWTDSNSKRFFCNSFEFLRRRITSALCVWVIKQILIRKISAIHHHRLFFASITFFFFYPVYICVLEDNLFTFNNLQNVLKVLSFNSNLPCKYKYINDLYCI